MTPAKVTFLRYLEIYIIQLFITEYPTFRNFTLPTKKKEEETFSHP